MHAMIPSNVYIPPLLEQVQELFVFFIVACTTLGLFTIPLSKEKVATLLLLVMP